MVAINMTVADWRTVARKLRGRGQDSESAATEIHNRIRGYREPLAAVELKLTDNTMRLMARACMLNGAKGLGVMFSTCIHRTKEPKEVDDMVTMQDVAEQVEQMDDGTWPVSATADQMLARFRAKHNKERRPQYE